MAWRTERLQIREIKKQFRFCVAHFLHWPDVVNVFRELALAPFTNRIPGELVGAGALPRDGIVKAL